MIGGTALTVSTNKADKNLTMENSFKMITELIGYCDKALFLKYSVSLRHTINVFKAIKVSFSYPTSKMCWLIRYKRIKS